MMESCSGVASSPLHRSSYVSWYVDSAESTTSEDFSYQQCTAVGSITLLPLPGSETTGGLTDMSSSHQPNRRHRASRHSHRSLSNHHPETPPREVFSQKHGNCHNGDNATDNNHSGEGDEGEGEGDDGKEGGEGGISPPEADPGSPDRTETSLLHPEVEVFFLPRSSPVISRRRRSLSWHGHETDGPSVSSSRSTSSASAAPSPGRGRRHQTVLHAEDLALAPGSTSPSPCQRSSWIQEDRKSRCTSVSSNLNWLLSVGLHLPFRGQQGLAEERKGRGLSTCDAPPRPVTQHPSSKDRASSDIPQFSADIFKTSCDLEKENAHFVVVDMVLEVLEGVKWTLSLDQLTSTDSETTNTHTQTRCRRCTPQHTRSAADRHTPGGGQGRSEADTHTHKHTRCCSAGDAEQTQEHEDGPEKNFIYEDRNTHRSAAGINTHEEEEKPGESHHTKTVSVLSTDSGFEDCGVEETLTQRDFLRRSLRCPMMHSSVERLAQQLVLGFRRSWLPSQKAQCGRHSLRTSLQELPGTTGVVVSSGSLTEEIRLRTRMRGTLNWAPPRFQIIFTVQQTHRRSDAVALQHFLCAGCGTEVELRYIKKLRYCEYLGKYFCDCCHSGSESVIPGRVLTHWDFSRYPVSDFSKQLLDSVWHQPLFDLTSVGKTLYGRVRELDKFRELQEQLLGIKKLLTMCRFSGGVIKEFEELPGHLTQQPHLFSLDDLLRLKKGQLVPLAKAVLLSATEHMDRCELCLARGFICEFCRERDILFPFQSDKCRRCPVCKACFHKRCFTSKNCPKCARIRSRRKLLDGASLTP